MDEKKKVIIAGAGVICLIVLAVLVYYLFFAGNTQDEPVVPPAAEEKVAEEIPEEEVRAADTVETLDIDLDKSDDTVRDMAKLLSANPEFAQWLVTKDIIRKFTAAVDNIANGESPRGHIPFFKVEKEFKVEWKSGNAYIDPASFARYNPVAAVFESLDTQGCIRLFRQLKPAIQESYRDLGYPEADFEATLQKAIAHLLKVPVPGDEIEVEKEIITFTLKDPSLETMSDAQKHLYRMGPSNVSKILRKLREFADALGRS